MIDPISLIVKTGANYIAYKAVRGSVDYVWDKRKDDAYTFKHVQCSFCLKIWTNCPEQCPHCNSKVLKKLYKDYDYKKEENGMMVDNNLTMR